MKNKEKKLYIIRKFVFAENITDALKKEKRAPVEEIYLEDGSLKDVLFERKIV